MLQVKDPQEVFDENIRPMLEDAAALIGTDLSDKHLNSTYSIFVLGEMYGTVSTCLAQNIPIPKEMWDMPVVKSFVRGDVDDVLLEELNADFEKLKTDPEYGEVAQQIENSLIITADNLRAKGFNPTIWT